MFFDTSEAACSLSLSFRVLSNSHRRTSSVPVLASFAVSIALSCFSIQNQNHPRSEGPKSSILHNRNQARFDLSPREFSGLKSALPCLPRDYFFKVNNHSALHSTASWCQSTWVSKMTRWLLRTPSINQPGFVRWLDG